MTDLPSNQTTQAPLNLVAFKKTMGDLVARGELVLPSNVDAQAFQNAAVVAFSDNPAIARCSPQSVFRSLRRLAGMGLIPDGIEAALVPFRDECQAMPMVGGLVKRARNSGEVRSLWSSVVYEGETVEIWVEDGEQKWAHVMEDGSRIKAMDRGGEVIGAYAVAKLADGTVEFEPLPKFEIDKMRNVSRAKNGPAWSTWYSEMAKKSAIRRLCKRLPISAEDRRIIAESETAAEMRDITPRRRRSGYTLAAPDGGGDSESPRGTSTSPVDTASAPDRDEIIDHDASPAPGKASGDLPDELSGVYDRLLIDMDAVEFADDIDEITASFAGEIEAIRDVSPIHGRDIDDAVSAARERVE